MKNIQMNTLLLFITLISLAGCANKKNIGESSSTVLETVETSSQYAIENTTEEESQTDELLQGMERTETADTEITDPALSEDAKEIQDIVETFSAAYFSGGVEEIKKYLTDPYDWDIEVYSNPEKSADISVIAINGISDIGNKNVDDICVIAMQYKQSASDDTVQSLTIELIKKSEGWKIQFYGIE